MNWKMGEIGWKIEFLFFIFLLLLEILHRRRNLEQANRLI